MNTFRIPIVRALMALVAWSAAPAQFAVNQIPGRSRQRRVLCRHHGHHVFRPYKRVLGSQREPGLYPELRCGGWKNHLQPDDYQQRLKRELQWDVEGRHCNYE